MTEREFWDKQCKADDIPGPRGWIQWKGTSVCMDLHCECGEMSHFDGDFFYFFECPHCRARYSVGSNVKLHKMTSEELTAIDDGRFKLSEP